MQSIILSETVCNGLLIIIKDAINNNELNLDLLVHHVSNCDTCKNSIDTIIEKVELPPMVKLTLKAIISNFKDNNPT